MYYFSSTSYLGSIKDATELAQKISYTERHGVEKFSISSDSKTINTDIWDERSPEELLAALQ